jgi:ADP-ribosylglycohydrolase
MKCKGIIGAIVGDIVGSVYEIEPVKTKDFVLLTEESDFTDDTVLTLAVADAFVEGKSFSDNIQKFAKVYPDRGYGGYFKEWVKMSEPKPYGSYGNGSAMRVSPVAYVAKNMEEVMDLAKATAEVTHNHPEGIKGAQAIASSIYLAEKGALKYEIKEFVEKNFLYDLDFSIAEIRKGYKNNATCQRTVPEAIVSFLESNNFEEAIRLSVWLGGDSDTLACMSGAISAAFYRNIPNELLTKCFAKLDDNMKNILDKFSEKYCKNDYEI